MWRLYFGEISDGRILRLPFIGWSILLSVLMILIFLGIAAFIGVAEHVVGGDIQEAQNQLRRSFGIPAVLLVMLLGFAFFFAHLNLMAKRIRDIGLHGWWTILIIVLLSGVISYVVSDNASAGFSGLVGLALLLVPSRTLQQSN